ncbi:hypothetical protein DINM_005042 [Dirofilaria immitis]|nr:hypothetical protein [Dirofilaria immitis]
MTTTTKSIVEEYEKLKNAKQDRMSLRQKIDSKKIVSADRIEDLLNFPIGSQENLRKTDRIYMTDDNKRLLLIREYGTKSWNSENNSFITVSSPRMSTNLPIKSDEILPMSKSDLNENNGCTVNFKVFVDDNISHASQGHIHQIHVHANCPDFLPKHLYVNGMKFSQ